jgi:hypothetical protein
MPHQIWPDPHNSAHVEMMKILPLCSSNTLCQLLAERDGDEVFEDSRHIEEKAVHGNLARSVLNGGASQNELGQPQRRVVSGIQPRRYP